MPNNNGFDRTSLPHTWEDVSLFIQKFITYEGHFSIILNYHFQLLAHLRIGWLINLPYYFMKLLQHMEKAMKGAKHPKTCVTNHVLIKLIITH